MNSYQKDIISREILSAGEEFSNTLTLLASMDTHQFRRGIENLWTAYDILWRAEHFCSCSCYQNKRASPNFKPSLTHAIQPNKSSADFLLRHPNLHNYTNESPFSFLSKGNIEKPLWHNVNTLREVRNLAEHDRTLFKENDRELVFYLTPLLRASTYNFIKMYRTLYRKLQLHRNVLINTGELEPNALYRKILFPGPPLYVSLTTPTLTERNWITRDVTPGISIEMKAIFAQAVNSLKAGNYFSTSPQYNDFVIVLETTSSNEPTYIYGDVSRNDPTSYSYLPKDVAAEVQQDIPFEFKTSSVMLAAIYFGVGNHQKVQPTKRVLERRKNSIRIPNSREYGKLFFDRNRYSIKFVKLLIEHLKTEEGYIEVLGFKPKLQKKDF